MYARPETPDGGLIHADPPGTQPTLNFGDAGSGSFQGQDLGGTGVQSAAGPVEATLATELGLGLEQQDFGGGVKVRQGQGLGGLGVYARPETPDGGLIHADPPGTQPTLNFGDAGSGSFQGQDLSGMGGEAVELLGHRGISASCKNNQRSFGTSRLAPTCQLLCVAREGLTNTTLRIAF